ASERSLRVLPTNWRKTEAEYFKCNAIVRSKFPQRVRLSQRRRAVGCARPRATRRRRRLFLAGSLVTLAGVVAAPLHTAIASEAIGRADWPTYGHDSHRP